MKLNKCFILGILIGMSPCNSFSSSPRLGFNFTSVNAINCAGGIILVPENPTANVGPTQYIVSTYQALRSFNKITGQPDGALNIDASPFGFSGGAVSVGDPVFLYDRFSQRWFFSYEGMGSTTLQLAVSNSAAIAPDTQWNFYVLQPATINPLGQPGGSLDYNQPAVDQNAWYNGVATFNASGTFLGSSLTVIPKSSILAGNPNITVFSGLFPEVIPFIGEGFAIPATNFDSNPQYGYFLWLIYNGSGAGNQLQFYRILDAGSNIPTLGPLVTITIPDFAFNGLFSSHKGNLYGNLGLLQNLVGRFAFYPHIRNHQLYLCQDIQLDSLGNASTTGDRIGIRWYQFDMTGDSTGQGTGTETPSTVPVLIQSGTLFDPSATNPLFYFNSSIMTNKHGDLCISFSNSGNNAYVNAGFAFRAGTDPLNTLQTPVLVTDTNFSFNFGANESLAPGPNCQRWGDASMVVTDPSDDTTFWLTQPFAALQNAWGIQTTQVIPAAA